MKKESEEELPIMQYEKEIVSKIKNNAITIIFGGYTGCGKSTKIPQFVLDDSEETCNILVTQPRKIAAMTVAKRVAYERKCELGNTVGYQVGLSKKRNNTDHQTKLLYCTTGVVIEKIIFSKSIDQFSHIILDEIHEMDADTDLLMNIVRELLLLGNTDTKLILMSATLNLEKFRKYFTLVFDGKEYPPAVVSIETDRKYSIDVTYMDELEVITSPKIINYSVPSITSELFKLAVKIIKLHIQESNKSILVFLPGIYEIESLNSMLANHQQIKDNSMVIILHSSLTTDQQKEAFMRSTLPKIILSTNLAESSVTIPDVECVIDFCLTKNIVCEKDSSMSSLKLEFASKNSCIQRAGRTGRVCDGKVYRLIHRRYYDQLLLQENISEMQRAPLETVILRVKSLDIEGPVTFLSKCISPPDREAIRNATLKLKYLGGLEVLNDEGFFNISDGDLTFVGKIMANLPIDVQLSKLIALGYIYSVLDEIVVIAAGLNLRNIFKINYNNKLADYTLKTRWANGSGCDAITILNAYKFWQHEREKGTLTKYEVEQKWCNEYGLDRKNLHEMRLLVLKIQDRLKNFNLEPLTGKKSIIWSVQEKQLMIKICLTGAFIPNLFIQGKSDEITERDVSKDLIGMDPNRTVYFRKMDRDTLGFVYADRIKEQFVSNGIADAKNKITVTFDSSKVFVQFADTTYKIDDEMYDELKLRNTSLFPGNISHEVYKSIKYRKVGARNKTMAMKKRDNNFLNSSFEIKVLSVTETNEYAKNYGIIEEVNGKNQIKKILCSYPEHVYLPSYNTKVMHGWITHIEHCNKFYFQTVDEANSSVIADIELNLKNEALVVAKNLKIDKLVVAFHDYYHKRAKIVAIRPQSVDCYMFDYGYTVEVNLENVYELDEDTMKSYFLISERCFECRLAEIAPSYGKCPRGKWTQEAIQVFCQKADKGFGKIVVYSVVDEIAAVELYIVKENINEYMIKKGYARKVGEPYLSKLNHNERINVQNSVTDWIPRAEEFKDKESTIIKVSIPSPSVEDCSRIIRLDGPYSPLETNIFETLIKSSGKMQVDPLSINSVVLDYETENYDGVLLVAAERMKNSDHGLTLYNVSMLPNIFGLPALMAIIFAPNVMFYSDSDQKRFVGVRFGLGYDEKTGEAYNFKDDGFLPINYKNEFFDDIADINDLRYCMSTLLHVDPSVAELTENEKEENMKAIKHLIIKILGKKRQPVEASSFFPDRNEFWMPKVDQNMSFIKDMYKGGPYRSIQVPELGKKVPANK